MKTAPRMRGFFKGRVLMKLLCIFALVLTMNSFAAKECNDNAFYGQDTVCANSVEKYPSSRIVNYNNIEATLVSKSDANKIFDNLKKYSKIPFQFNYAGCEERAYEMARQLDLDGIKVLKTFATVDTNKPERLYPPNYWRYHVAIGVLVKEGKDYVPYVIDPSLMSGPVRASEWVGKMKKHNKKMEVSFHVSEQKVYDPEGRIVVSFDDEDFRKSIAEDLEKHEMWSHEPDGGISSYQYEREMIEMQMNRWGMY